MSVDSTCRTQRTAEQPLASIIKLKDEFHDHNTLYLKEVVTQKEIVDRMLILQQRYVPIANCGNRCEMLELDPAEAANLLLLEYNEKLKLVRASNQKLTNSLKMLRKSCKAFEEICNRLDFKVQSPFVVGDIFHKPIAYYIEVIDDAFKFFHAISLRMNCYVQFFDIIGQKKLDQYKKLLEPSESFQEYLTEALLYCGCLDPKKLGVNIAST